MDREQLGVSKDFYEYCFLNSIPENRLLIEQEFFKSDCTLLETPRRRKARLEKVAHGGNPQDRTFPQGNARINLTFIIDLKAKDDSLILS